MKEKNTHTAALLHVYIYILTCVELIKMENDL